MSSSTPHSPPWVTVIKHFAVYLTYLRFLIIANLLLAWNWTVSILPPFNGIKIRIIRCYFTTAIWYIWETLNPIIYLNCMRYKTCLAGYRAVYNLQRSKICSVDVISFCHKCISIHRVRHQQQQQQQQTIPDYPGSSRHTPNEPKITLPQAKSDISKKDKEQQHAV